MSLIQNFKLSKKPVLIKGFLPSNMYIH